MALGHRSEDAAIEQYAWRRILLLRRTRLRSGTYRTLWNAARRFARPAHARAAVASGHMAWLGARLDAVGGLSGPGPSAQHRLDICNALTMLLRGCTSMTLLGWLARHGGGGDATRPSGRQRVWCGLLQGSALPSHWPSSDPVWHDHALARRCTQVASTRVEQHGSRARRLLSPRALAHRSRRLASSAWRREHEYLRRGGHGALLPRLHGRGRSSSWTSAT